MADLFAPLRNPKVVITILCAIWGHARLPPSPPSAVGCRLKGLRVEALGFRVGVWDQGLGL